MEEAKTKQDNEIISDEQVNELYNEIKGERKSIGSLSKIKTSALSGIKKIENDIQNVSPILEKTKNELTEGKAYLKQNAPIAGTKIKGELSKGVKSVKENAPKFGKQTKASFIDWVEKIYGASTRGKEYGEKSIEILRKVWELRESGLITEEEYEIKKKEILKRV